MFDEIQQLLQRRADLLMAGRYEDLSHSYAYPHVIYLNGTPHVIPTPEAHIGATTALHAVLVQRRVYRCLSTVTMLELPRNGRLRVWADWTEVSSHANLNRQVRAVFYLRKTVQGYRSEMSEFVAQGEACLCTIVTAHHLKA